MTFISSKRDHRINLIEFNQVNLPSANDVDASRKDLVLLGY